MNIKERGFTLIELLVVIAIIGILSSVVLASLNTARDKGNDAAIKSNLANLRAQAELFYDGNTAVGYSGLFDDTNDGVDNITAAVDKISDSTRYEDSTDGWAALAQLRSDSTQYWCVDFTGYSGTASSTAITNEATSDDDVNCQ